MKNLQTLSNRFDEINLHNCPLSWYICNLVARVSLMATLWILYNQIIWLTLNDRGHHGRSGGRLTWPFMKQKRKIRWRCVLRTRPFVVLPYGFHTVPGKLNQTICRWERSLFHKRYYRLFCENGRVSHVNCVGWMIWSALSQKGFNSVLKDELAPAWL